ncbi:hypothetical protein DPV05_10105 [Salmonella enterica]|nr:hypothetical protein [Salmonella enterica]EBK5869141.1 hypothetical protein [Salmonella enterica subsp. enterica serovar Amsterdam]ECC3744591.1 hypothetical protein [Salmonella enterica subsp. enterica]EAT9984209.1 hypothetical protein [Salmonella enterica]EBJ2245722.1 hypothetical protein [Salmonella enterica]
MLRRTCSAHRRCVAHILLSGTYKSNNFSRAFIVCTLHAQLVCKKAKKSVLSTDNLMTRWSPKAHHINSEVEKSHEGTTRASEKRGCVSPEK